jgi:glycosyltransferase involved in cell wall biosynthesis
MKIAVIGVKGLPARQGGIERACQELYPRLVQLGHSVDLFARPSYTKKGGFSPFEYQGIRIIGLPAIPLRGFDALFCAAFGTLLALFGDYDVIHFHALGPALFSWLPRFLSPAKVVVTCHGLDWQRAKWGKLSSSIIYLGERAAVKYADRLIVVSQDLQQYFAQTYGLDTLYIPNGAGKFAPTDGKLSYLDLFGLKPQKYLLFLGRLVPEKRPDLLIKAFQQLELEGWKLVLTGGSSDTEKYGNDLRKLAGDNHNIVFTGELQGKRLAEIVRGAGLFVLPSDLEGLPLVMLEAMKEGIPILASDIPPHKQLIGQDKGFLFRAGNQDSMISSLKLALNQPDVRRERTRKAKEHIVAIYDWDKIALQNLDVYSKLVSGNPIPTAELIQALEQRRDAA